MRLIEAMCRAACTARGWNPDTQVTQKVFEQAPLGMTVVPDDVHLHTHPLWLSFKGDMVAALGVINQAKISVEG